MDTKVASESAPRLLIPGLQAFYDFASPYTDPLMRVTLGGILIAHGWPKLMGGVAAFAAGSMARRGLEPAMALAYWVIFLEIVGGLCIAIGLFTRFFAAAVAIEMAVITFYAHWGFGFSWTNRGYEYPLMWGIMMFVVALRGGRMWSVDRKLGWEL